MKKVVFFRIVVLLATGLIAMPSMESRAAVSGPPPLKAMPVTLAWNAANDSTVRGYALYYGPANQPNNTRLDAGTNTSTTIFGMSANVTYRLFAVSYNAIGMESPPSNEVLFAPPAISRLQLARESDGIMRLDAKAAPGTVCSVMFTPTLDPPAWQPLLHTTSDQLGNIIAQDISAKQADSRFYRLAFGSLPLLGALKIQRQPNGTMQLESTAPPGALCTVLFTSTLESPAWQPLLYTSADQAGKLIAQDMTASQAKSRFYRVALGALPMLGDMQINRQPDGNMLLTAKAPPGASCRVLYASAPNAEYWPTLQTVTADAGGNVAALDTTAREANRRFYRMAMP